MSNNHKGVPNIEQNTLFEYSTRNYYGRVPPLQLLVGVANEEQDRIQKILDAKFQMHNASLEHIKTLAAEIQSAKSR